MYSFTGRAAHETATNRAASPSFTPPLIRRDTGQGRTISVSLELTGYLAGGNTGDCIVGRDAHGSGQQVTYRASALDQGRLLEDIGLLIKLLRQQVLAEEASHRVDPRGEQTLEVKVEPKARAG